MGNQASKVLEKSKEKKERKRNNRRKSTVTLGSFVTKSNGTLSGNFDWVQEETSKPKAIPEFLTVNNDRQPKKNLLQDDLKEFDRLQRQHYLLKSARKSNMGTELTDDMTIVDSGTGNGIWALEIAAEYGGCKVIALDVRLPEHQGKPENLIYTEADVTQPWPIESNSVDFVFQRSMGHVISQQHWPQLVCEIHRVLKPKGRMELIEADLWHHNPGPILRAFNEFLEVQCEKNEIDFRITERIPKEIEAAGFQTIEYRSLDIPIGEWPQDEGKLKQFGFINKEIQKALLRNRKSDYMALWGLTSDDYDSAIQDMMNEFEDYRGFSRFNCWTAQKNH